MPRRRHFTQPLAATVAALLLAGCASSGESESQGRTQLDRPGSSVQSDSSPQGTLTLAFAGDVHFEDDLAGLLQDPDATLGPMTPHLRGADLAMVNLESALATEGRRTNKELEDPSLRYWFRSPPAALDLLDRSGVDVVTVANNHGADFGTRGLRQTLAAAEDGPIAVVGAGADAEEAFAPHRLTVQGHDVAVLAADASPRESEDPIWAAGEGGPAIASARGDATDRLAAAVQEADRTDDLVVVYLHWGRADQQCPTDEQRRLAETLAEAGADVVVGAHAHVLLGAGMLEDTYVAYGLGNFLWYHGATSNTGVLKVQVTDGRVSGEQFVPARIPRNGGHPQPLEDNAASRAHDRWQGLRGCTGLDPVPAGEGSAGADDRADDRADDGADDELPAFESDIRRVTPALRQRMIGSSHHPDRCPVALADLRHLSVSYVGFDSAAHTGELVVHADHAEDVVGVFEELYTAGWPIRRMRLVDEYDGDDDRSMAADNTSAYNCRRIAGQDTWSAHAYGAAIDLNPVENPYVVGDEVRPADGRRFAEVDRSPDADAEPGVIREGDVVMRAFARIGWTWGGNFSEPDYQHFAAP